MNILKIEVTTDYKMFHHLKGNRTVRPAHVKELQASYEAKPILRQAKPVLLNEHYEIVDGQHGFQASRNLSVEVFYMVVPSLTITDARILNALQRSWSLLDYADSYAETGVESYKLFVKLREQYPLPASAMITYMTGGTRTGSESERFKIGQFEIRPYEDIVSDLKKLEDLTIYNDDKFEQALALALNDMMRVEGYDHARMVKKVEKHGLNHYPDKYGYLRELEQHYNVGLSKAVRFI